MKQSKIGGFATPSRDKLQPARHLAILVIAVISALMGAVLSVLPALVLGLVTMFYNSTGGILIFLGSLLPTLPHPVIVSNGSSALPIFQQLGGNLGIIMVQSAIATLLCSIAAATMVMSLASGRNGRLWLMVGLCCLFAAIIGGRFVACAVVPAIAISIGYLIQDRVRSSG